MENAITNAIREYIREELEKEKPRLFPPLEPVPHFKLYSVKEAAKILSVSTEYIYSRIKDGSIGHVVDLGAGNAKYRIRADDLSAFIESRTL